MVVLTCCKGDCQSQWKTPIFGPSQLGNLAFYVLMYCAIRKLWVEAIFSIFGKIVEIVNFLKSNPKWALEFTETCLMSH